MTTEPTPVSTAAQQAPAKSTHRRNTRETIVLLAVGLVAGLVAFGGISRFGKSFPIDRAVVPLFDLQSPSDQDKAKIKAAGLVRSYKNTALSLGIFGAIVGGTLGLAEGLLRRSGIAAVAAAVAGIVLGGALGAAGGLLDVLLDHRLRGKGLDGTYVTMIMFAVSFTVVGLGIGIAAGIGSRNVLGKTWVVAAAGLVAGLLYPALVAAFFPVADADIPRPEGTGPLLLWTLLPAGLMGLAAGRTPAAGSDRVPD